MLQEKMDHRKYHRKNITITKYQRRKRNTNKIPQGKAPKVQNATRKKCHKNEMPEDKLPQDKMMYGQNVIGRTVTGQRST